MAVVSFGATNSVELSLKKKSKHKRPGADPFTGPREVCLRESLTMTRCIRGLGLEAQGEAEGSCD